MRDFDRSHLSDTALLASSLRHDSEEYGAIAEHLADLGEIDARKLYLAAAYTTMVAWCMAERHMHEQKARKRVRIAQSARRHPALLHAIADGRLHLSAALLILPWLTEENADELIAIAADRTISSLERMLAERFRHPEVTLDLGAVVSPVLETHSGNLLSARTGVPATNEEPGPLAEMLAMTSPPVMPKRITLHITIDEEAQNRLRYVKELLGHTIPSGSIVQVLYWMLDLSIRYLEKQKYGATDRPRRVRRPTNLHSRHIPSEVKRTVHDRDGDRCTFVSETGRRCDSRTRLEFDHVVPFALGGRATVDNIRLRCHAHNQYEAELTYGAGFMERKRAEAPG